MDCPLCESDQTIPFLATQDMYTGEPHRLLRCTCCGLVRTDRTPHSERLYVYGETADAGKRFGLTQELLRWFRRARVRRFVASRPGRALDVGCGDGSFLEALADGGWDVHGTELSAPIAASARRRLGDRIRIGELEDAAYQESSFDLITIWHVLEHLNDPRKALAEARRLIKPEGTVVVAVPNIESFQAQLFKGDWLHLDVPRHQWHFDPGTLTDLAQRCGFDVKETHHFSAEYGPFGIVQGIATTLGGGYVLFTRLLRLAPLELVREASFWPHILLLTCTIIPSFLLEALAAVAGRGGAVVMVLKPKGRERSCSA